MKEVEPTERKPPNPPESPVERLDQERLRAWRTDCRHHEDEPEGDGADE